MAKKKVDNKCGRVESRVFKDKASMEAYLAGKMSYEDATELPIATKKRVLMLSDVAEHVGKKYIYASWLGGLYFWFVDMETGEIISDKPYLTLGQLACWSKDANYNKKVMVVLWSR